MIRPMVMTDTGTQNGSVPKGALTAEWGNRNLYQRTGFDRREFLPQLRGLKASQVYREMVDNDWVVGAILFAIEMLLRRVEWEVEPGGNPDPGPEEQDTADFVSECMADMSHSWADFIADVMTMLPHGYAYLETVYKYRVGPAEDDATKRSQFTDSRLGWRKFVLIPQDSIKRFMYDEFGGVQGVEQQSGTESILIPIGKALLFRTTQRTPYGRSVLRNAYLPWYHKKRIEEIESIGIERDLVGLPILYLDPTILADETKRAEYQDIIRNTRRNEQEGVLLPAVFDEQGNQLIKMDLLSTGGQRTFDTNTIINRWARAMAMTLLQDVIMLGHEKVGTQALAGEKRDLSDTALSAWLGEIASIMNTHAIPRLLLLNGMPVENPPTMSPAELRQSDVLEFAEAVRNIAQAGYQVTGDLEVENFVRRKLGLPLMDEDDLAPPPPGPEELAALMGPLAPPAPGMPPPGGGGGKTPPNEPKPKGPQGAEKPGGGKPGAAPSATAPGGKRGAPASTGSK